MDVSRIKKRNLKVWLPLFDGVDVLCRHLPQSVFDDISALSDSIELDPRNRQKSIKRDEKKFRSLLCRAVVEDWRGLENDGEPFPCTDENKDFMMEEVTEFRLMVLDAPLNLGKMLEAEREAQEKNSSTTSEPQQTSLG